MTSLTELGKSLGIILRTCHYLRIGTKKDVGENKKEWVICTRFTIGCDLTLMLFLHRFWLVKNKTLNKKYFISLRMYLDIFSHLCSTQLAPRCHSSLRGVRLGRHPPPWRQSSHPVALELHLGRILTQWTIATEKTVNVTPVHDCKI